MPPTPDRQIKYTSSTPLALWRAALHEEIGISVAINPEDLPRIRPDMYQARKKAINTEPELGDLQLLVASGMTEIWIVRKSVELE